MKGEELVKLPGYYIFTQHKLVIPLDIFKVSTGDGARGRMDSDFDIDVRANDKIINSLMD